MVLKSKFLYKTHYGAVVQLVRTPACHAGGREFESRPFRSGFYFYQISIIIWYMIYFIIGPGGSGKTTTGKILAKKINFDFIDLDDLFCKKIENIRIFIKKNGYTKYCQTNSSLLSHTLPNTSLKNTIFVLSSGFLVHEGLESIVEKNKKLIKKYGKTILLLPSSSLDLSTKIVVKRQLSRGFGLNKKNETKKFIYRFKKYIKMGDIQIFSHQDPDTIADKIKKQIEKTLLLQ